MPGRIGIFGGTFDPPHIGHLVVAQDVWERLELDRLIVIPAGHPPHREAVLGAEERLALVRRAFDDDDRIQVSDIEVRRNGPSWTVDTLEWARREMNPDTLFLIVGADQLRSFHGWKEPERILSLARLAVMTRPGEEMGETDVPCDVVEVTRVELSSTRIRKRLEEGESIRYMVPECLRRDVEQAWSARRTQSHA